MDEVLILGNGISRINYHEFILKWSGEVWGCNRAYLEYGNKLTRLTGHADVLQDAEVFRDKNNLFFEIWGGHIGTTIKSAKRFDCPKQYQTDSGTTLIAQALHEGFNIVACGFDLGGWDIHSPELENAPKDNWVERWRILLAVYGEERIRFIGHDHKPFLLSMLPSNTYCQKYTNGFPHINDPDYLKTWEKWTGKKPEVFEEEYMTKVKFPDGREVEMKDFIAKKMAKKGKVEILKQDIKPAAPEKISKEKVEK